MSFLDHLTQSQQKEVSAEQKKYQEAKKTAAEKGGAFDPLDYAPTVVPKETEITPKEIPGKGKAFDDLNTAPTEIPYFDENGREIARLQRVEEEKNQKTAADRKKMFDDLNTAPTEIPKEIAVPEVGSTGRVSLMMAKKDQIDAKKDLLSRAKIASNEQKKGFDPLNYAPTERISDTKASPSPGMCKRLNSGR